MSKYNKHYIDDIDDIDNDDEDDGDLCDSDLEVISNNNISKSLPRLRPKRTYSNYTNSVNTNTKTTNYDKYGFYVNDRESSPMSDIEPNNDKLLSTPMTDKERDIYTGNGITLIIEYGRASGKYPTTEIFISDWRLSSMLKSFNTILSRFSKCYEDYAISAIWDDQTRPYSLDWNDINSLYLPLYRTGFCFYLTRIQRRTAVKRVIEATGGEPAKKKAKSTKGQRNRNKQMLRAEAIQKIQLNIEPKYSIWINQREDKTEFWMRCAYFVSERQWTINKLQKWLYVNYIQPEQQRAIDAAQSTTFNSSTPSKTEINDITDKVTTATTTTPKATKSIHSIALNSKYYQTVMRADMEQENNEFDDQKLALIWEKYKSKFKKLSVLEEDEQKKGNE